MTPKKIRLPNNWQPRWYQKDAWKYLEQGGKHLELICHRRWGKDDICLHHAAIAMFERPATYWHMLPQANQVRKAIWDAVNPRTGKKRIDEAFPDELFKKRHSDMFIQCRHTPATWQALGSDNFQSFIGSPPAGIVYSEWAQANPSARGYLRPIIAENNGYQIFVTTPRGRNHAYRTFKAAQDDPHAMAILQTVEDTKALTLEELAREKLEYISTYGEQIGASLFEQEWYCSFEAAVLGAVYGKEMREVENSGRVCLVPHQPGHPVYTAWDIGRRDATAVWFWQYIGGEIHIIDFLCESLKEPDWFASQLLGQQIDINIVYDKIIVERGPTLPEAQHRQAYDYQKIWLPHDAKAKTFAAKGKSLEELFAAVFGWKLLDRVPELSRFDGINAARKLLPRCYFDHRTMHGVDCLRSYHYEWDDKRKIFTDNPYHDHSSNAADAFRYMAICAQEFKQRDSVETARFSADLSINEMIRRNKQARLRREGKR